jgi:hypothetical protein
MSKPGNGCGSENRVNIPQKAKVGKNWNLFPAVVESNGHVTSLSPRCRKEGPPVCEARVLEPVPMPCTYTVHTFPLVCTARSQLA